MKRHHRCVPCCAAAWPPTSLPRHGAGDGDNGARERTPSVPPGTEPSPSPAPARSSAPSSSSCSRRIRATRASSRSTSAGPTCRPTSSRPSTTRSTSPCRPSAASWPGSCAASTPSCTAPSSRSRPTPPRGRTSSRTSAPCTCSTPAPRRAPRASSCCRPRMVYGPSRSNPNWLSESAAAARPARLALRQRQGARREAGRRATPRSTPRREVAVLRFAPMLGPTVSNYVTRFFSPPARAAS